MCNLSFGFQHNGAEIYWGFKNQYALVHATESQFPLNGVNGSLCSSMI